MSSIGLFSIWSSLSSDIVAICAASCCCIPSNLFSSAIFDSLMEKLLNIVESCVKVESSILTFRELSNVDGNVVSDADVTINLVF